MTLPLIPYAYYLQLLQILPEKQDNKQYAKGYGTV